MSPTIVHIITNLSSGGAERMLYKLLAESKRDPEHPFKHVVISMVGKEYIGEQIEQLGIPVHTLGLKRAAFPTPKVLRLLLTLVRDSNPAIVQGWMYHGNLAAWFATKILSKNKSALSFNVRHSVSDISHEKPLSRLVIRLGARAAASAAAVIYNSKTSAVQHEGLGYPAAKREILPNGFTIADYRVPPAERAAFRADFDLSEDHFLIALIGRFHPMKDHRTFVGAAKLLLEEVPQARFVLVGREVSAETASLMKLLDEAGVRDAFFLLGERNDIPRVLSAVDVLTSCSAWGEGFSNVIGEACAAGRPVVVTDVGDAIDIVGEDGRRIDIGDAPGLARTWQELYELGAQMREELGLRLRERVSSRFSLSAIASDYRELFERISPLK